ncbi:MAG: response regulator transcription factor [Candidatus Obscuribacterales bacterium]|nr:response regulator transcription factor [Candidatus Obscuribacterales bacterium]
MAKILIVEDDVDMVGMLEDWLLHEHHVVEAVTRGEDACDRLKFYFYDLIILDWQLPDLSGLEVLKTYRAAGGLSPILMLTGKNAISDKEAGLDSGADDYLTKPFNAKELSARIRALLRRPTALASNQLVFEDIVLDPQAHKVFRNGEPVDLLPKEFALLEFFMRNPGQSFNTDALLDRVWKSESDTSADTVRVTLQRLRKRIDSKGEPSLIETRHRIGYKLRDKKKD